jgi:hypothetical protein
MISMAHYMKIEKLVHQPVNGDKLSPSTTHKIGAGPVLRLHKLLALFPYVPNATWDYPEAWFRFYLCGCING